MMATVGMHDIAVVIPSRNGASRLPETLRSIGDQKTDARIEVLVVDDGSTDGTSDVATSIDLACGRPRVLSDSPSRGRAAARNRGIHASTAPFVLFLDDDMTLMPGALDAHWQFHSSAAEPRVALGRIVVDTARETSSFARFLAREDAYREQQLLASAADVDFACFLSGHLSIPRSVLLREGGFDERIARYGVEDVELGYRLAENGIPRHYLPAAASIHRTDTMTLDQYLARQYECGLVARDLARRHPDGPLRRYLRVDPPSLRGIGGQSLGLIGMKLTNRLLLHSAARKVLVAPLAWRALRSAIRAGEHLRLDRLVHFGYYVARDIRYFEGVFGSHG